MCLQICTTLNSNLIYDLRYFVIVSKIIYICTYEPKPYNHSSFDF